MVRCADPVEHARNCHAVSDPPEIIEDDVLYLAPCRPAMIRGVPLHGWLVCVSGIMLPLIIWGFPSVFPAGVLSLGLYYALREAFSRDFNCFNIILAWAATRAYSPGVFAWGGASFDPLPQRPKTIQEARRRA